MSNNLHPQSKQAVLNRHKPHLVVQHRHDAPSPFQKLSDFSHLEEHCLYNGDEP